MRTTVDLDDELLAALKDLAHRQGSTLGQVISALTRQSLSKQAVPAVRNGVRLFTAKSGGGKSNLQVVKALRDDR